MKFLICFGNSFKFTFLSFNSENLKTMVNILELVLLKGDIALENQVQANEFSPEGTNLFRKKE